jgi:hypothetical protein
MKANPTLLSILLSGIFIIIPGCDNHVEELRDAMAKRCAINGGTLLRMDIGEGDGEYVYFRATIKNQEATSSKEFRGQLISGEWKIQPVGR